MLFKSRRTKALENEITRLVNANDTLVRQLVGMRRHRESLEAQWYKDRHALRQANKGLLRLSRKVKRLQGKHDFAQELQDRSNAEQGVKFVVLDDPAPNSRKCTDIPAGVGGMEVEE